MTEKRIVYDNPDGIAEYTYKYPGVLELIKTFPEAKKIIPLKIKEWEKRKREIIKEETLPYFEKCSRIKDPLKKAFWKEVYGYLADDFTETIKQLQRLKRLWALINAPEKAKIAEEHITRAKEVPLEELYNFRKLRRYGRSGTCCCPLHDDRGPSFHIYKTNTWYCFGCHKGGDTIDFIQQLHGLSFQDALNHILGGAA